MEDDIIINARVEGAEETQSEVDKLTSSIKTLSIQNANLLTVNKQLESQGKKNSQEYQDNAKTIQNNQQAIQKNTAERKVLTDGMKAEEEQSKKNKAGLDQYSDSVGKLIPGFDGLTGAVKVAGNALSIIAKHPIILALTALVAILSTLAAWFTKTEEGGDTLAKVMAQLEAIVGVVLDRVAALGGALYKFFTGDWEGAFSDMKEVVTGVADEMVREWEMAGKLAEILDELEDRERSYKVAVSETTNEIKRLIIESKNRNLTEQQKIALLEKASNMEIDQNKVLLGIRGDQLNAAIKQLEMDQSQFNLKQKIGESDKAYAIRLVNDSRLMGEARQKVADAVIALNEAEGESLNLQEKISNAIEVQNQKQKEKLDKLAELQKKEEEAAQKSYNEYQKELARQQALQDKIQENIKKKEDAENQSRISKTLNDAKAAIDHQAQVEKAARDEIAVINKIKEADMAAQAERLANYEAVMSAILGYTSNFYNMSNELSQLRYKNEKDQLTINENEKLAKVQESLRQGLISEEEAKKQTEKIQKDFDAVQLRVKKQAFEANKKNQIIQTEIDVVQSSVAAFRSLVGVPFVGPILAAAAAASAIVFGNLKIQEIKKQQFVGAEGGMVPGRWTTLGGQYHNGRSDRGTQFWGTDGTTFMAEKDEGLFILKRSAHAQFIRDMSMRNQKHGGRSWSSGGGHYEMGGNVITVSANQQAQSEQQMTDLILSAIAAQPAPRVLVDDIDSGLGRKTVVENTANLLG